MKSSVWAYFRNRTIFRIIIAGFWSRFFPETRIFPVRGPEWVLQGGWVNFNDVLNKNAA
jgi:hypothetical protein